MYSAQERYMVKKLSEAGLPTETVAKVSAMSERSVRRIKNEPEVANADEESLRQSRKVGRPSQLERYKAEIL